MSSTTMILKCFLLLFAFKIGNPSDVNVKGAPLEVRSISNNKRVARATAETPSDYPDFLDELQALGRILNGLAIDKSLRNRHLNIVELATELARIALNHTVVKDIEATNWAEAGRVVTPILEQIGSMPNATWQVDNITDRIDALEFLVNAVKMKGGEINKYNAADALNITEKLTSFDYTFLDTKLSPRFMELWEAAELVVYTPAEENELAADLVTLRNEADQLIVLFDKIDAAATQFTSFHNQLSSNVELGKLLDCLFITKSATDSNPRLAQFFDYLSNFAKIFGRLQAIRNSQQLEPLVDSLVNFAKAFVLGPGSELKFTWGLPNGAVDLKNITTDLEMQRNHRQIGGGGDLTMLEDHLEVITKSLDDLENVVKSWKGYHVNKKTQSDILDTFRMSIAKTLGISQSSMPFVGVALRFLEYLHMSKNGTLLRWRNDLDALKNEIEPLKKYLKELPESTRQLSRFQQALSPTRPTKDILQDIKDNYYYYKPSFKLDIATLNTTMNSSLFKNLNATANSRTPTLDAIRSLFNFVLGLENYQTPDRSDLKQFLTETREIGGELSKIDIASWNLIGELVKEVQKTTTDTFFLRTQTDKALGTQRNKTGDAIDTWHELDAFVNVIGHTIRSAMLLGPDGIPARLDQIQNASKELDEALKRSDVQTKNQVELQWRGYGSFESDILAARKQIAHVEDSVPAQRTYLRDLVPVVEQIQKVEFDLTKLTEASERVKRIPTTNGDQDVMEKVTALQAAFDNTFQPVLEFQSHSQNLKKAPAALESIFVFFLKFFGITLGASEDDFWLYVWIGLGVVLVVVLLILIICYCKKRRRKYPKKSKNSPAGSPTEFVFYNDLNPNLDNEPPSIPPPPPTSETPLSATPTSSAAPPSSTQNPDTSQAPTSLEDGYQKKEEKQKKKKKKKEPTPPPKPETESVEVSAKGTEDAAEEKTKTVTQAVPSETNVSMSGIVPVKGKKTPAKPEKNAKPSGKKTPKTAATPSKLKKELYAPNYSTFSDPKYDSRFVGNALELKHGTVKQVAGKGINPNRQRWINTYTASAYARLVEEAEVVVTDGRQRLLNAKLKVHVADIDMPEPHNFLEHQPSTGPELLALKPLPEEYGVFLGRAMRFGMVTMAAIFPWNAIQPGGSERWWPGLVNETVTKGNMVVKLVSETNEDDIYTAKIQMWNINSRSKKTTVHLNILTAHPVRGVLFSIDALVKFHSKINAAQYASKGNLLRYGECMAQIGNMVAINQCVSQITAGCVEPKMAVHEIQQAIHECICNKEEYIMIYLTVLALIRESLDCAKTTEQIEMERMYEARRMELELESTVQSLRS